MNPKLVPSCRACRISIRQRMPDEWFLKSSASGLDPETAGDEMKYDAIAAELWVLWSDNRGNSASKSIP
jgi:hypothetical protein